MGSDFPGNFSSHLYLSIVEDAGVFLKVRNKENVLMLLDIRKRKITILDCLQVQK